MLGLEGKGIFVLEVWCAELKVGIYVLSMSDYILSSKTKSLKNINIQLN